MKGNNIVTRLCLICYLKLNTELELKVEIRYLNFNFFRRNIKL